jgi:hypothetical protein
MARLTPKAALVFGQALAPSGNIAVFGSLAASSVAYSADPAVIQNAATWLQGWVAALINAPGGNASPALEDFNGILYVLTYQLAYLKQMGLAEWDATVTYYNGAWAQDGAGTPYKCIQDPNTNHILTDTNWWVPLKDTLVNSSSACKAWVTFNGLTGAIISQFNVASITKTATGCYVVGFTTALANANYAWAGSCGTPDGGIPGAGDNNVLVGGAPGKTIIKTTTQLTIFCWEADNSRLEDSQLITLQVFGT